jgi:hypothetical protein
MRAGGGYTDAAGQASESTLGMRSSRAGGTSRVWRAAADLALYVGIALWLTWPLARYATTHLSGLASVDALHGIWALTWAARAAVTDPAGLFEAPILHPTPRAFFFAPNGLGPAPLFAPLYLVSGNPALAVNVTLLLSLALAAWGLHRIAQHWTGSWMAGAVAGATLLTSSQWTLYLAMWPTYLSIYYFPWLIALVATSRSGARPTIAVAALLVLQCLADPVYVAPAVLAPVAVIAFTRLLRADTRPSGFSLVAALMLAALTLTPLYLGYLDARAHTFMREPRPPGSGIWQTLAEPLALPWRPDFAPVTYATLALIVTGVACRIARRTDPTDHRTRRAWANAATWTVVGLLLCTPVVAFSSSVLVHNPLHLLVDAVAPGALDLLRGMQRLSLAMTMGLALLAGLGFGALRRARFACHRWR